VVTRDKCREIQAEVETALQAIAAKHGLTVKLNGGRFTTSSFAPKVEFLVPGAIDGGTRKAEDAWNTLAKLYGLNPAWLGKDFTARDGDKYRVMGLLPGRTKNVVKLARVRDNRALVAPVGFVTAGTF
jgi:hypothetical protein